MIFRSKFKSIENVTPEREADNTIDWEQREDPIPVAIIVIYIIFLVWAVLCAHYPALFLPAFFAFMGF